MSFHCISRQCLKYREHIFYCHCATMEVCILSEIDISWKTKVQTKNMHSVTFECPCFGDLHVYMLQELIDSPSHKGGQIDRYTYTFSSFISFITSSGIPLFDMKSSKVSLMVLLLKGTKIKKTKLNIQFCTSLYLMAKWLIFSEYKLMLFFVLEVHFPLNN